VGYGGEVRAGGGELVWYGGEVVRCGPAGTSWCGVVRCGLKGASWYGEVVRYKYGPEEASWCGVMVRCGPEGRAGVV
jgi:hypothetical protein